MDFTTLFSAVSTDFSDARRQKIQNVQKDMEEKELPQDAASMKKFAARMSRAETKMVEAECLCTEVEAKYNLASAKAYSWVANHPGTVAAVAAAAAAAVIAVKNKKRTESAREEVNNLWNENAKLREELRKKEEKENDERIRRSFIKKGKNDKRHSFYDEMRKCNRK